MKTINRQVKTFQYREGGTSEHDDGPITGKIRPGDLRTSLYIRPPVALLLDVKTQQIIDCDPSLEKRRPG